MTVRTAVEAGPDLASFERLIGSERTRELHRAASVIRERLAGGTLWHVNSTGAGGGVAEMLHTLVPLYRSLGVPASWAVIGGDQRFFTITKRLGTALYGSPGDGGPLGGAERAQYLDTLGAARDQLQTVMRRDDVAVLHDHQTVGLIQLLGKEVSAIYWRCHVGVDEPTESSERAWAFVSPMLDEARALIFSVGWHAPSFLPDDRVAVLPPFISPFATKNRELDPSTVQAALNHCGLATVRPDRAEHSPEAAAPSTVRHPATVVSEASPEPEQPLLVQVSRWDRLKDMEGVLTSCTSFVDAGYVALVGPDPTGIPDDIEQGQWFNRCLAAWRSLPVAQRRRSALICLPMLDLRENALLVNAVQRSADVVLQKSLAEGFGLTVAEAMWKSRVVVASAVGGIRAQVVHGETGLLLDDPLDLPGFGGLAAAAAQAGAGGRKMGARAHDRVWRNFLPDREVVATAQLLSEHGGVWGR